MILKSKTIIKKVGIGLVIVGWALGFMLPCGAHATDLSECYKAALSTDPVLAKTKAEFKAAQASRPLAMSPLLPNLEAGAKISESNVYLKGLGPIVDDTYTISSYSVTLTQAVIDVEAWAGLEAADREIKAAAASVLAAKQNLLYRVVNAYLNVLQARADLKVAESNERLLQGVLDQAQAFLKHGTGDVVSVQEAQARLDAAQAGIIKSRNAYRTSIYALERLTHQHIDNIADFKQFEPMGPRPDNVETWVETALEKQPLINKAKLKLSASEKEIQRSRYAHVPKLHIVAGNSYGMKVMRPEIRNRIWEAGLQLSVPLYLGGRLFANTAKAVSDAEISRQKLNSAKDEATFDTRAAFLGLKDSVAALKAARRAVMSARTSLESTQKGYEVGTRTAVDVLDRINDLQKAEREYNVSRYFHILSRIRLKTVSGTVSEQDIITLNNMLQDN